MSNQVDPIHDASDRYVAAVAAAGQAVFAVRSGMGVAKIAIEHSDPTDETTYRAICTPWRYRGAASTLRFLVAGESAQVALGLSSFGEVDTFTEHRDAAEVMRSWNGYWEQYPHFYHHHDDWSQDEVEEETKNLIWLARWQVRRRFRYEPERSAIEKLALQLRDGKTFTGGEAERFVRACCRSRETTSGF